MPRRPRRSVGKMVYHVLNRANSRRRLFSSDNDYLALLKVLSQALKRYPGVELLAVCIMPNHWHLVLKPSRDGELSDFMRWLTQTHTQRWRHARRTVGYGSLYQGRFKSFIVQEDLHFLVLCRYVEANASRANLARRAELWRWGSAWLRDHPSNALDVPLSDWPVDRPKNWLALLNEPQPQEESAAVKQSIERNRPLGDASWQSAIVRKLKLEHTIRPPGRPRKEKN